MMRMNSPDSKASSVTLCDEQDTSPNNMNGNYSSWMGAVTDTPKSQCFLQSQTDCAESLD